jgi:ELWxxDGT repeat protein
MPAWFVFFSRLLMLSMAVQGLSAASVPTIVMPAPARLDAATLGRISVAGTAFETGTGAYPTGTVFLGGHGYVLGTTSMTWEQAEDACETLGGTLVTLQSQPENDLIESMATTDVWLGMNDLSVPGSYQWITGEALAFNHWAPSEPNSIGLERYVAMYMRWSLNGYWNSYVNVAPDITYACEFRGTGPVPPTVTARIGGVDVGAAGTGVVSSTRLLAHWSPGSLSAGFYDLVITNPDGGEATLVNGLSIFATVPTLAVAQPTRATTFALLAPAAVVVSGAADSAAGITQVRYSLTGATTAVGTASGTSSWSFTTTTFAPGSTLLTVTASDANGNETSRTVTVTTGSGSVPPDTAPPTVVGFTLAPVTGPIVNRMPMSVTVSFSEAIDPASVSSITAQLIGSGGDDTFADGNEIIITPTSLTLVTPDQLLFDLDGILLANDTYRVRLVAQPSGIRDLAGNALDGEVAGESIASLPSGNGIAGGDAIIGFRVNAPPIQYITASNPYQPSYPDAIAVVGGTAFVACTSATRGRELWITNGTRAGTQLLKDIAPGPASSAPWMLTAVGTKVFFSADDGINGRELWVSDGTVSGTILLRNIAAGSATSAPGHLIAVGTRLFFTAYQPGYGYALWTSDGTPAGTVKVKDVDTSSTTDELSYNWGGVYCALGNTLYFNASDPVRGSMLWKSDGTPAGTVLVKDLASGQPGSVPVAMVGHQGLLYYVSRGDSKLWVSDGTDAGTVKFTDVIASCDNTASIGGKLFVRGTTGSFSNGIWATDGDPANLIQVSTIYSAHGWLVDLAGIAYLAPDAPGNLSYRPLVRSDGTSAGTALVADYSIGNIGTFANVARVGAGALYFSTTTASGVRLFRSDGTNAGTLRVTDQVPDAVAVGDVAGRVLVSQLDDYNTYSRLWASNGTDIGTIQIFPPAPTVTAIAIAPQSGTLIRIPPTSIGITLSRTIGAASVTTASLQLIASGGDGTFVDGNETIVAPTSASLVGGSQALLDLSGASLGDDLYRLRASGTGATAILDALGTALDGEVGQPVNLPSGNDVPGGDFIYEFRIDSQAPSLAFAAPVGGGSTYTTGNPSVAVSGSSVDPGTVASVTYSLSGATIASGTAAGTTSWSFTHTYNPGTTTVVVTTLDAAGNSNSGSITIVRDVALPTVAITAPTGSTRHSTAGSLGVSGSAADSDGIAQVSYVLTGATSGSGTAIGTTAWSFLIPSLGVGTTTATVTARDGVGATATVSIDIVRDLTSPTIAILTPTAAATFATTAAQPVVSGTASDADGVAQVTYTLAGATTASGTATGTTSWSFTPPTLGVGTTTVTVTAHDLAGNVTSASFDLLRDTSPPALAVVSPATVPFTTTSTTVDVSGTASDDHAVSSVAWSLAGATTASGVATGTTSWTFTTPTLNTGATTVTITATDSAGNQTSVTINVVVATGTSGVGLTSPVVSSSGGGCGLGNGLGILGLAGLLAVMRVARSRRT